MPNAELLAVRNSSMSDSERREMLAAIAAHIRSMIKEADTPLSVWGVVNEASGYLARTKSEVGDAISYGEERGYFNLNRASRKFELSVRRG